MVESSMTGGYSLIAQFNVLVTVGLLALISHMAAVQVSISVAGGLTRRFAYQDTESVAYEFLILLLQIPAILICSINLRHQLTLN